MNGLNNLLAVSPIVWVIIAVAVIAIIVVVAVLLKKQKKTASPEGRAMKAVEFQGDNTQLVQILDILKTNNDATMLIVPPTHWGLLIRNGEMKLVEGANCMLYGETQGTRKQDTFSLKVVFISKTVKIMLNWGTKQHQRIDYMEPQIGPISIGAFGKMEVQVAYPVQFYLQVVANFGESFMADNLRDRVLELTVDKMLEILGDTIRASNLPYLEFIETKYSVQTNIGNILRDKFLDEYGFKVYNFVIEKINIPDDQDAKIKQLETYRKDRTISKEIQKNEHEDKVQANKEKRELMEDEDFFYKHDRDRAREEDAYARNLQHSEEDRQRAHRHEDEDRSWRREDAHANRSADADLHKTGQYYDAVKQVGWESSPMYKNQPAAAPAEPQAPAAGAGRFCRICGSGYKPNDTFCPGCGATLDKPGATKKCPVCGCDNAVGNNFCGTCNHKFN